MHTSKFEMFIIVFYYGIKSMLKAIFDGRKNTAKDSYLIKLLHRFANEIKISMCIFCNMCFAAQTKPGLYLMFA